MVYIIVVVVCWYGYGEVESVVDEYDVVLCLWIWYDDCWKNIVEDDDVVMVEKWRGLSGNKDDEDDVKQWWWLMKKVGNFEEMVLMMIEEECGNFEEMVLMMVEEEGDEMMKR